MSINLEKKYGSYEAERTKSVIVGCHKWEQPVGQTGLVVEVEPDEHVS